MTVPAELDARFRDRAAEEGLLDVAFDYSDSPVGPLLVAVTDAGLCRVSFAPEPERELDVLARSFGARVLRAARPVDAARRELDQYFAGQRRTFDLPVDIRPLPPFQRLVLHELARVPFGQTETYGGLAARIGRPGAARAVGGALNRNPIAIVIPCHRVVGANGQLVGYAGGLRRKRTLLALEGAALDLGEAGSERDGDQAQSIGS
jgi:methylated-DNA-[protein]-cysteine S-methyltransferase